MQTRTLNTLVTIVDAGSFAGAAKRLNMTLSAVSMQMKTLERDLDVQVFDRTVRPPRLTIKGREIVTHARAVLEGEHALLEACRPEGDLRGEFRIGFVLSASVRLLPHFLKAANERMPNARFDAGTGLTETLVKRIRDGELDLAVLTAEARASEQLDTAVLRTEPLIVAIPRAVARRSTDWLAKNLPFLLFAPNSGIGRLITEHIFSWADPPRRTIELDGMEAIVECVKHGIGYTILPKPDVERYASDDIAIRELETTTLSRELALIARRGNFTTSQFAQIQSLFA